MLTEVLSVLGPLTVRTGQSVIKSQAQEMAGPRWLQRVYTGKDLRPPRTPEARTRLRGERTLV